MMRGSDGKFMQDWMKKQQQRTAFENRGRKCAACYLEMHQQCKRKRESCECNCHAGQRRQA